MTLIKNETTITAEPGQRTIRIERWFDAPRHLVWQATTTPELVARWWAPCDVLALKAYAIDLRVGGAWRLVAASGDGGELGFHGEFREIVAPERLVRTFIFDPYPEAEAIETMTLVSQGSRTKLTVEILHATVAARDGHVASGMATGVRAAHAQLEAVVRELSAEPPAVQDPHIHNEMI